MIPPGDGWLLAVTGSWWWGGAPPPRPRREGQQHQQQQRTGQHPLPHPRALPRAGSRKGSPGGLPLTVGKEGNTLATRSLEHVRFSVANWWTTGCKEERKPYCSGGEDDGRYQNPPPSPPLSWLRCTTAVCGAILPFHLWTQLYRPLAIRGLSSAPGGCFKFKKKSSGLRKEKVQFTLKRN